MKPTAPPSRSGLRRTGGFTLFEAMLACAVFSIAAVALAHSLQVMGDLVANTRREEEVVRTLRTMLEEQRFLRPLREGEEELESPIVGVRFRTAITRFEAENRDGQPITGLYRVAVLARWDENGSTRERFSEALCDERPPQY